MRNFVCLFPRSSPTSLRGTPPKLLPPNFPPQVHFLGWNWKGGSQGTLSAPPPPPPGCGGTVSRLWVSSGPPPSASNRSRVGRSIFGKPPHSPQSNSSPKLRFLGHMQGPVRGGCVSGRPARDAPEVKSAVFENVASAGVGGLVCALFYLGMFLCGVLILSLV